MRLELLGDIHCRLVTGMVDPAYMSNTSYTPALTHRRYTAAIPNNQTPAMMSFPASVHSPLGLSINARPVDCLSRPLDPMSQAVALFRLASSRNERIQLSFLTACYVKVRPLDLPFALWWSQRRI